jgi:hypothetical protein
VNSETRSVARAPIAAAEQSIAAITGEAAI